MSYQEIHNQLFGKSFQTVTPESIALNDLSRRPQEEILIQTKSQTIVHEFIINTTITRYLDSRQNRKITIQNKSGFNLLVSSRLFTPVKDNENFYVQPGETKTLDWQGEFYAGIYLPSGVVLPSGITFTLIEEIS